MKHVLAFKIDYNESRVELVKDRFDGQQHALDSLEPGDYVLLPIVHVQTQEEKDAEALENKRLQDLDDERQAELERKRKQGAFR